MGVIDLRLRYRTSSLPRWCRHPVGQMLPFLWVVLTLPKAPTDSGTIAWPPVDASWDGHSIAPAHLMAEPQRVSARPLWPKSASQLDFFAGTPRLWPWGIGHSCQR